MVLNIIEFLKVLKYQKVIQGFFRYSKNLVIKLTPISGNQYYKRCQSINNVTEEAVSNKSTFII